MCVHRYWGYTCGHCTPPFLVKCPQTLQAGNFPPCEIAGTYVLPANQFCHGCMRANWNKGVIAEEEAHRGRHERGECNCEVIFDRSERERREKEAEIRGKARRGGRRGRGGKAVGEGSEGKGGCLEGNGGMNGGFSMGYTQSRYLSPRDTDPASYHPQFEYANDSMKESQMDNTEQGDMNPMTGVIANKPICNPPIVTSTTERYGDMPLLPLSPRMNAMGAYPTTDYGASNQNNDIQPFELTPPAPAGPSNWHNPAMAPPIYDNGSGNGNIYAGDQYTWNPNPEPNGPIMNHQGTNAGPRMYYPATQDFAHQNDHQQHQDVHQQNQHIHQHRQNGHQQNQNIDVDAQRNAHSYVGYYMDHPPTNGAAQAHIPGFQSPGTVPIPMNAPQPNRQYVPAPRAGMIWYPPNQTQSYHQQPAQTPYYEERQAVRSPAVAPRHFTEHHSSPRRHAHTTRPHSVQRSIADQSIGRLNMQANTRTYVATATPTGAAPMSRHPTMAANQAQGQATMYLEKGQETTQDQSQKDFQETTINTFVPRTPMVISSLPIQRPNSVI